MHTILLCGLLYSSNPSNNNIVRSDKHEIGLQILVQNFVFGGQGSQHDISNGSALVLLKIFWRNIIKIRKILILDIFIIILNESF